MVTEIKKTMLELQLIGRDISISREMLKAIKKCPEGQLKLRANGPKFTDKHPEGRYQAIIGFPGYPEAVITSFVWPTKEEVETGLREFVARIKTMAL